MDDDDDFIVPDDVDEDEDDEPEPELSRAPSRASTSSSRASSRLSNYAHTDASEVEDDIRETVPARKAGRPPLAQKSGSKRGSSNLFLTAAEQRQQKQKEDKKSSEDPFEFLQDVRDKDGVRPGQPGYDPRTLYIPPKAWKTFTPFEKQVCIYSSMSFTPFTGLALVLGN